MAQRHDSSVRRYRVCYFSVALLALMFAASGIAATVAITAPPATALALGGEVSRPLTLVRTRSQRCRTLTSRPASMA